MAPQERPNARPIKIPLKRDDGTSNLKQYSLRQEAQREFSQFSKIFLETDLIKACRSKYNTSILLVKKPNSAEYHFVEDLRAINEIGQDLHSGAPNPYTGLTTILRNYGWF